jgi:signal transduction histidine kinase
MPLEPPPTGAPRIPAPKPRHPLRFAWQMDAEQRFALGSDEFIRLIGPRTAVGFGRPWREIAEIYGMDPAGRVPEALASREPWDGLTIYWPVDGGGRLPVELSGTPIYDPEGNFAGYRGVGVCRVLDSLDHLEQLRAIEPADQLGAEEPPAISDVAPSVPAGTPPAAIASASIADDTVPDRAPDQAVEMPENVVPFRPIGEQKLPVLTAVETNAFDELAKQLSARLEHENRKIDDIANDADATPAWLAQAEPPARGESWRDRALLDLLPTGILIYRLDRLLYANPAFLGRIGYNSVHALEQAGGLETLYVEPGVSSASSTSETGTPVTISASQDSSEPPLAIEARLFTISWDGEAALALMFEPGQTVSTPPAVTTHLLREPALNSGREPVAERLPGLQPANPPPADQNAGAVVLANTQADMLVRMRNEIQTPLNAVLELAEVMMAERSGALGEERSMAYTRDMRTSGERVITIINDLLDLARVETDARDLAFADQNLNEMVESCVSVMQPQANRERIIIRTSLAQALPPVIADGQSLRQITLNLIGNSIHLANPAGQVIVSTALSDFGEVVLRVRDTGHGLNDNEIAAALEPLRHQQASDRTSDGAAVNLSLTKALVEANRARFHIKTGGRSGTLIEVIFPHAMARA